MADDLKNIEERLKKSFQSIKQDISSIKDSLSSLKHNSEDDLNNVQKEVESIKNRKEDNAEIKKLSRNILDLTNYLSELKEEIRDIKKAKPQSVENNEIKSVIEFNEVKTELSELKSLIENIKIPKHKDYSQEIGLLSGRIDSFESILESVKKSVKSIRIPVQKDYTQDLEDLARELGEVKGSFVNRKSLDRESIKIQEKISEKISELESKQRALENKLEEFNKRSLITSLRYEISALRKQIENKDIAIQDGFNELKSENRKLRKEMEEKNLELKNHISYLKGRVNSLTGKQSTISSSEEEPFRFPKINFPKPSKNFYVVTVSIIIVAIILLGLVVFIQPTVKAKYEPIDIVTKNITGLPMEVYLHQNRIFTISGWESKINYSNRLDRIAGNNLTGWFFNDTIIINETEIGSRKYISSTLAQKDSNLTETKFDYTLLENKPYFKVQLTPLSDNSSNLGQAQYGFIIKNYSIYLQNGTMLVNDNSFQIINGTSERKGSVYQISKTNYEIFFNSNSSIAFILYSKNKTTFLNNFYWNIFWIDEDLMDKEYSPIYVFVLEDSNLSFSQGKWNVTSKYYSGYLEEYIYSAVSELDNNESNN